MALAGKWKVTVHTFMGDQFSTHEYVENGSELTGTITDGANGSQTSIVGGETDGTHFKYTFTIRAAIGEMEFTMEGDLLDNDTIKGVSTNAMGGFDFDGVRI